MPTEDHLSRYKCDTNLMLGAFPASGVRGAPLKTRVVLSAAEPVAAAVCGCVRVGWHPHMLPADRHPRAAAADGPAGGEILSGTALSHPGVKVPGAWP